MAIHIHYRKLCEVRIDHDPSLDLGKVEFGELSPDLQDLQLADYDIHRWLEIAPVAETDDLMARQRLRLRKTPRGFEIAGSEVDDKLERATEAGMSLWFLVFAKTPSFAASANLPLDAPLAEIGYFTTRHGDLQLTKPIPVFDPAATYRAGDLVVDIEPPNVLLEALRNIAPKAAPAASDWLDLPAPRFVTGTNFATGDRVLTGKQVYLAKADGTHPAPPSAQWTLAATPDLRNGASRADRLRALPRNAKLALTTPLPFVKFTIKDTIGAVVKSGVQHRNPPALLDALEVSLPHEPRGVYRIEATDSAGLVLPGFPLDFLLLPEIASKPLGVIELQIGPDNTLMFGPASELLGPAYQLRFRKRHTFWRYTFHGNLAALPPADPGELVPDGTNRFVTAAPLPLTRGLVPLRKFDGKIPLPNPPVGLVLSEGGQLFSDTFIRL